MRPHNVIKCLIGLTCLSCSAISSKLHNHKYYDWESGLGGGLQLESFGEGGSCIQTTVTASLIKKPVDIIFVIDNSGSMSEEISGVVSNIDTNFAQIMAKSGIDYRIIMLTQHGNRSTDVCVEAPLSSIPIGGCLFSKFVDAGPGIIPGKFYQYSIDVESNDSPCLILQSLYGDIKDQYGLAPGGLTQWLREEAVKVFIEVSDDRPTCNYDLGNGFMAKLDDQSYSTYNEKASKGFATTFDKVLTDMAPQQFGTPANRNYVFYSLIGLQIKAIATDPFTYLAAFPNAGPTDAYVPTDTVTQDICPTAVGSATGYQWLSKNTGGLRSPICLINSYGVMFNDIAKGIYANSAVVCNIEVPKSPDGQAIDFATMRLDYTPNGDDTLTSSLINVSSLSSCGQSGNDFYYDADSNKTYLCPDTCVAISQDFKAKLELSAGCTDSLR